MQKAGNGFKLFCFSQSFSLLIVAIFFSGCGSNFITSESSLANVPLATHGGWTQIQALGARVPVEQSSDLESKPAEVTLSWNEMTLVNGVNGANGAITSYQVYRSTTSASYDFSAPLVSEISTTSKTYTDTTVISGNTYFYIVVPVAGTQRLATTQVFSEVKIQVPPENMALVHRWMANLEMCGLMGRTADPDHNYRCNYIGPGNQDGFLDQGKALFVDAYETGCNYSPAPACGNSSVGCLGLATPLASVGLDGDVFYDRNRNHCWIKTNGVWKYELDSTLTLSEREKMVTNKPGAPPLVYIDQEKAWATCSSIRVDGFLRTKRLPTHKEQVIASAWPSQLSNTEIDAITTGNNLHATGNCNLNSGNGLTFDDLLIPLDYDTLPCTFDSTCQLARTGSDVTRNCKTRYGVQDMIGNVHEWSSDQLNNCSSVTHTCSANTSTLDPNNTDWNGFLFNGQMGPGGGSINVNEWAFVAKSYGATRIQLPLGLPMVTQAPASYDSIAIGTARGQVNPAVFRNNVFRLNTDGTNASPIARGAFFGGSFYFGAGSGRFTLSVRNVPTAAGLNIGLRCVLDEQL